LKQVNTVVANSAWTQQQLIEEGILEDDIRVVTGGLDSTVFHPPGDKYLLRKKLGIPNDVPVIITAANLVMKKGIDTVLRVVADLASKWQSLRYFIVGDGSERVFFEKLTEDLGVADRVIFTGRKTQSELCQYYQAADIYVQISRNAEMSHGFIDVETMGRTYMEAGACELPVIASRVGGVPSVVQDHVNGLLVEDPLDQDEIARNFEILLENAELRQQLGQAGLKMAREQFSWERVAEKFEQEMLVAAMQHSD
jgi:hypothetical protein